MANETTENEKSYLRVVDVPDLIRLGSKHDGGYVVPRQAVIDSKMLLSFGLSTNWNFECDYHKLNPSAPIQAYDHTVSEKIFFRRAVVSLIRGLKGRISISEFLDSLRILVGWKKVTRVITHHQRRVTDKATNEVDISIDQILSCTSGCADIFVKMDIEGGEYRAVPRVIKYRDRLLCLVVEFHDTEALRLTFESVIEMVCEHFVIVHVHGNNFAGSAEDGLPDSLEITFMNKRVIPPGTSRRPRIYLDLLDAPCDPGRSELYVPES